MVVQLGNLNTALRAAQSGLGTTQQVLDVVANNVANVHTPGYSRKVAQLDHTMLAGVGVGVEMKAISRTVDQGLLATLRRESGALKAADIAASFEGRLQDVFGTPESNSSIAHFLTALQTAIQSLAASPDESLAARDAVRWAEQVGNSLNQMSGTVQGLRREADQRLAAGVREASTLLANIADLNRRIVHDTLAQRDTTGLADARDRAADRLAELLDVRVMTREQGDMVIFTAAGRTLVDGTAVGLSHVPAASVDALSTYAEGDFTGIFAEAAGVTIDITSALGRGELGQLVALRDQTLPDVQSTLDSLAATLRDTLNQVHNRGVAFPGLTQATGSRVFADPSTQTISLASGDTVIALFDAGGNSRATTALSTLMGGGSGPWTIAALAGALDGWLKTKAGAEAAATLSGGALTLDTGGSGLGLAFRDQVDATPGSARADAQIAFSADGGAGADETVAGFSSFFGLNDLFVDKAPAGIRESAVMPAGWRSSGAATIQLRAATWPAAVSVAIPAGNDIKAVADAINAAAPELRATLVPDGNGARLRLATHDGSSLVVTETAGSLISQLGLGEATTGLARSLSVRADIAADPLKLTRGVIQWDQGLGAAGSYFLGRGDGTAIAELSRAISSAAAFASAGSLAAASDTLAGYAGRILGDSAVRAAAVEDRRVFQQDFVATLKAKSESIRGVNLDQELSDLMLYEQAYSAAARVISVIQRMYEALEQAV